MNFLHLLLILTPIFGQISAMFNRSLFDCIVKKCVQPFNECQPACGDLQTEEGKGCLKFCFQFYKECARECRVSPTTGNGGGN